MGKVDKEKIKSVLINIGATFVGFDACGETNELVYLEHHERWDEIKEHLELLSDRDCVEVPELLCFVAHLRKLKLPGNIPKGNADYHHLRDSWSFEEIEDMFYRIIEWASEE